MEHDNSSLVELLPKFFHQWPKNLEWAREKDKKTNIDASQLTEFFSLISEPLKGVQHRSLSFDPWEVAGLGRKEIRSRLSRASPVSAAPRFLFGTYLSTRVGSR